MAEKIAVTTTVFVDSKCISDIGKIYDRLVPLKAVVDHEPQVTACNCRVIALVTAV